MYRALVGELPFRAGNAYLVLTQQVNERPIPPRHENPNIPYAGDAILLRAMAKEPAQRFQSADEMLAAIEAVSPFAQGENLDQARALFLPLAEQAEEAESLVEPGQ